MLIYHVTDIDVEIEELTEQLKDKGRYHIVPLLQLIITMLKLIES